MSLEIRVVTAEILWSPALNIVSAMATYPADFQALLDRLDAGRAGTSR
jgi:hypothetical protein